MKSFHDECAEALDQIRKDFSQKQEKAHKGSGDKAYDPQIIEQVDADLDSLRKKHKDKS